MTLFDCILLLTIAGLLMRNQTLSNRLGEAMHHLDFETDMKKFWFRMATGGAFAETIEHLDVDQLEHGR